MSAVVLDSWAVLRLLEGTVPAATRVQEVLDETRPLMSWINLGEVYSVTRRQHGTDEAKAVVRDLRSQLTLDAATERRVMAAAAIKADHRLAYADAFAAATAIAHDAVLLTGDPELLIADGTWHAEDLRG